MYLTSVLGASRCAPERSRFDAAPTRLLRSRRKHWHMGYAQRAGRFDLQTRRYSDDSWTIPFLYTFLRTLLQSTKSQLFSFQVVPHSLGEKHRGWGTPPSGPTRAIRGRAD